MSAWEAPPSIVKHMMVLFCADFECDEFMCGRAGRGLASCEKIWPGPADGVLDDVCDEEREDQADEPAQYCDVCFMCSGTSEEGP